MFEGLAGRTRNEAEATVVEFLRERADEILEFTCELIRTPSVNPPGDEVPISKVILEKLRMLGVTERQIVGALDERPNVLAHVHMNVHVHVHEADDGGAQEQKDIAVGNDAADTMTPAAAAAAADGDGGGAAAVAAAAAAADGGDT